MKYSYKAKRLDGEVVSGVLEADNRKAVVMRLQQIQVFPIAIEREKASGLSLDLGKLSMGRISRKDILTFTRQLSDLLNAGLPLARSLEVLCRQTPNPKMLAIVRSMNSDVVEGLPFSTALKKHGRVFPDLYCAMVHAGEAGGSLDGVLKRLAQFLENEAETRAKIVTAMTYPMMMVVVMVGVVGILFTVVIPKFQTMFEDAEAALPASTMILMGVSEFVRDYWYIALIAFGAGGFLLRQYMRTESGREQIDILKIKIPLLKDLVMKREVAKFARTLGTLLHNGVNILSALSITEQVIGNRVLAKDVHKMGQEIREGQRLSDRMEKSELFPPIAVNMVAVGEETGELETTLGRVADSFEAETDRVIKTITTLLEPIMIVIMAVVVGFIVFSMIMPIFNLSSALGGG